MTEETEETENKVHEYDPVIYPRKLWVTFIEDGEEISDFRDADSKAVLEPVTNCYACTFHNVEHGDGGFIGELICLVHGQEIDVQHIAHEAVHAANGILEGIGAGISTSNDEAQAYLVGWVAKCINEVVTNKESDNESE